MDWSKVEQIAKDNLLPLFLDKLEEMGVTAADAVTKAETTVALGADFLVKKLQGKDVSGDLGFIEGTLWGIVGDVLEKETDKQVWIAFGKGALQTLIQIAPQLIIAALAAA